MTIRELSAGSVFKLIFLSAFTGFLVLAIIFGTMAAFGANTVNMNGQPVYGLAAIPASLLIVLFISTVFSGFTTLGFFLLRLIRPNLIVGAQQERRENA